MGTQGPGTKGASGGEPMSEWSHPVFKTPEEFEERLLDVLAVEQEQENSWWYLSFATEDTFLGGLYIRARGTVSAVDKAIKLGLNPGGQVQSVRIDVSEDVFNAEVPMSKRMRLLTAEEVNE